MVRRFEGPPGSNAVIETPGVGPRFVLCREAESSQLSMRGRTALVSGVAALGRPCSRSIAVWRPEAAFRSLRIAIGSLRIAIGSLRIAIGSLRIAIQSLRIASLTMRIGSRSFSIVSRPQWIALGKLRDASRALRTAVRKVWRASHYAPSRGSQATERVSHATDGGSVTLTERASRSRRSPSSRSRARHSRHRRTDATIATPTPR
jgi:hypothetical protein